MASSKSTILLIHGAFSTPATFDRLVPYLQHAGFPTLRATFPSSNPKSPLEVTTEKDAAHVREQYLAPLIEQQQKNVILVMHSYGGVVGAGAAFGLSQADRSTRGLKGGVVGLIYISGHIIPANQTLLEFVGGKWPPWIIREQPEAGMAVIEPLMETLCGDCDQSLEPEIRQGTGPHGYASFVTKVPAPCWAEPAYSGRLAYIRTTQDKINPVFAQDLWIEGSGVQWDVVSMDTSHAPYLSQPEKLAEHIIQYSRNFEGRSVESM